MPHVFRALSRRGKVLTAVALAILVASTTLGAVAFARGAGANQGEKEHKAPVTVNVFSPGAGDVAGISGAGFVVDLSLDATTPKDNAYLSAANGYHPFFNTPGSSTFHPGADLGAPGLVVLLSTTQNVSGTPFKGPGTNLAGLFQINTVARVNGNSINETWNTWQVGKPIAGSNVEATLTVFVVKGTAPSVITGDPEEVPGLISNVVRVHFRIAGTPGAQG